MMKKICMISFILSVLSLGCIAQSREKVKERVIIESEKDWNKVKITHDASDVEGLKEINSIKITAWGNKINTSPETLESKGSVMLQKEAAKIKAHIVLVEDTRHYRAYGDLPSVTIEGKAFGYQ